MLRLDLRDLFAVERPGRYRLDVTSRALTTDDGKPGRLSEFFAVTGPGERREAP